MRRSLDFARRASWDHRNPINPARVSGDALAVRLTFAPSSIATSIPLAAVHILAPEAHLVHLDGLRRAGSS